MNLIRNHTHRGITGSEAAIVLIAFVIVAAALAFVVLNMGFSTTQKAKETIGSGLSEASSGMMVGGKVTGLVQTSVATLKINATAIPIKVPTGSDSVNLNPNDVTVKYLSNSVQYDDIYVGAYTGGNPTNLRAALVSAAADTTISGDPWVDDTMPATEAFLYWPVDNEAGNPNTILDQGEHAVLGIAFKNDGAGTDERPTVLDKMRVEVTVAEGAALTLEREVPVLTKAIVDLG